MRLLGAQMMSHHGPITYHIDAHRSMKTWSIKRWSRWSHQCCMFVFNNILTVD